MAKFEHLRHKSPRQLNEPRGLVLACAPLRTAVNLSRIARAAGCCGVTRLVCAGRAKLDPKIARDAAETLTLECHRSLVPALRKLREDGYTLVGLEQTTNSTNLHEYRFDRRTALVVGNERQGLTEDALAELDAVVEIPVWGLPYSYNVATATVMAMYEYCRQWPDG